MERITNDIISLVRGHLNKNKEKIGNDLISPVLDQCIISLYPYIKTAGTWFFILFILSVSNFIAILYLILKFHQK